MKGLKSTLMVATAALLLGLGGTATSAIAVTLTNTSVTNAQICALFDCVTQVNSTFDKYSFNPPPNPDGDSAVTVLSGLPNTAAAGLFLYNYDLFNYTGSTETLHGYSVDFTGLVTTLDLNGDLVPDTSWNCSTCGLIPGSDGAGTLAPDFVTFSGSLSFSYAFTGIAPGVFTTDFGAISKYGPSVTQAVVLNTVQISQPTTLAPNVPEPASLLLLGSGLLGLGIVRRKIARG